MDGSGVNEAASDMAGPVVQADMNIPLPAPSNTSTKKCPSPSVVHNHYSFNFNLANMEDMSAINAFVLSVIPRGFPGSNNVAGSIGGGNLPDAEVPPGPSTTNGPTRGTTISNLIPSDPCCVCYDKMPNCVISCEHIFCQNCVLRIFEETATCPLCRELFHEWREIPYE